MGHIDFDGPRRGGRQQQDEEQVRIVEEIEPSKEDIDKALRGIARATDKAAANEPGEK